jgi:hypothetical protein
LRDVEGKDFLNKDILESKLLNAEGGIALRVGDDLILWKDPDARMIKAAGVVSRKPIEIRKGHYTGRVMK